MFRQSKLRRSPEEKAEILAAHLLAGVPACANVLLREVAIKLNATQQQQFVIELFVFKMHILDRMAYGFLGSEGQARFGNRLIASLANGIMSQQDSSISCVDLIAEFRDTYNRRQVQYAAYRELLPSKDQPLKGTLCWEFSKILLSLTGNTNPAKLLALVLKVSECVEAMLGEVDSVGLNVSELLQI